MFLVVFLLSFAFKLEANPEEVAARIRELLPNHCALVFLKEASAGASEPLNVKPKYLVEFFQARAARINFTLEEYEYFLQGGIRGELLPQYPGVHVFFEQEIELLRQVFRSYHGSGQKDFDTAFYFENLYRQFKQAWGAWLLKRLNENQPMTAIRIVGLGRGITEPPWILKVTQEVLKDRIDEATQKLGLQLHLYDKRPEVLENASIVASGLESKYPWAKGRIHVSYLDMTMGATSEWEEGTTGLVITRNSLRRDIFRDAEPFLHNVNRSLSKGGFFLVDWEAANAIEIWGAGVFEWSRQGRVGLENSDDDSYFFVRY